MQRGLFTLSGGIFCPGARRLPILTRCCHGAAGCPSLPDAVWRTPAAHPYAMLSWRTPAAHPYAMLSWRTLAAHPYPMLSWRNRLPILTRCCRGARRLPTLTRWCCAVGRRRAGLLAQGITLARRALSASMGSRERGLQLGFSSCRPGPGLTMGVPALKKIIVACLLLYSSSQIYRKGEWKIRKYQIKLSCVWFFAIPWTVACQVLKSPLSMGILQPKILQWVAIPFSRGSSQPSDRNHLPHWRQIRYHLSHQDSLENTMNTQNYLLLLKLLTVSFLSLFCPYSLL